MTIQTIGQVYNPITGVFGTGNVQFFAASGTWTVPQGIGKVRVRVWGAGGPYSSNSNNYGGGGGGGFAIKTIYDLTGVTSVSVTVGAPYSIAYVTTTTTASGGTSSFGSYCSATGGSSPASSPSAVNGLGGTGIGGDINTSGGYAFNNTSSGQGGGGGCGSIFGSGGNSAQTSNNPAPSSGGAGAGHGYSSVGISYTGGNGFFTTGGIYASSPSYVYVFPQSSAINSGTFPLDFIGTGGGGAYGQNGVNGGGGAYSASGGFPGGGNGYGTSNLAGGGLVIVEW